MTGSSCIALMGEDVLGIGCAGVELPGAVKGKVVTRFPPDPAGYLDIGHTKALVINKYFAEVYQGTLILRFDDTNPQTSRGEYVEKYLEDVHELGLMPDRVSCSSDYFERVVEVATRLIQEHVMYVDNTPSPQMRKERAAGQPSVCRDQCLEDNLKMWGEMQAGTPYGCTCCLRMKMDMQNKNKCLRDPVMVRVCTSPHYKTGSRFKVYPTYDFSCPLVDALEGVTHALRTLEFRDRDEQYQKIQELVLSVYPQLRASTIWEFPRINFQYNITDKGQMRALVEEGLVTGWDDPRLPTWRGLKRAGMTARALKMFLLGQISPARKVTYHEWDKIWTVNRKVIDPVSPRHMAIVEEPPPVVVRVVDAPEGPVRRMVNINKGQDVWVTTTKEVLIEREDAQALRPGDEVTLMFYGNVVIKENPCQGENTAVSKEGLGYADGQDTGTLPVITSVLSVNQSHKNTRMKLTWVPHHDSLAVRLTLRTYGPLITKSKLAEGEVALNFFNKDSVQEVNALGDPELRNCKEGAAIQLQRKGFYRVDRREITAGEEDIRELAPAGDETPGLAAARELLTPQGGSSSGDVRLHLIYIPDGHEHPWQQKNNDS